MSVFNHLYKPPPSQCLRRQISGWAALGKFCSNKLIATPCLPSPQEVDETGSYSHNFKIKVTAGMASFMLIHLSWNQSDTLSLHHKQEEWQHRWRCSLFLIVYLTCHATWPSDSWIVAMASVSCRVSLQATCRSRQFLPLLSMAALGTEDPTTCDQLACLQQIMSLFH